MRPKIGDWTTRFIAVLDIFRERGGNIFEIRVFWKFWDTQKRFHQAFSKYQIQNTKINLSEHADLKHYNYDYNQPLRERQKETVKNKSDTSYQRRPSSLKKREGNVRFPTNLHGVRRSARPTSRWAPKAHRMIGKTQWRHCERSFGTNVLVLGKERDNFPLLSEPLKTDVNKNVVIERFLN